MRIIGSIEVIEPPAELPVSVQEFIDHARLNGLTVDRQPDLIHRELAAATRRAERYLRRSILTQTLKGSWVPDYRSCDSVIVLPRGRVQSVEAVAGGGLPVDPAGYTLNGNILRFGALPGAPVEVVWISGYGNTGTDVPDNVREGILAYASTLYDDRQGTREAKWSAMAGRVLPAGVQDLWRSEQVELSG